MLSMYQQMLVASCYINLQNETESEDNSQASCDEHISNTCNAEKAAEKETSEVYL